MEMEINHGNSLVLSYSSNFNYSTEAVNSGNSLFLQSNWNISIRSSSYVHSQSA